MVDTAATETAASNAGGFDTHAFLNRVMRGDVALAVGILAILVMLLLPMPRMLLIGSVRLVMRRCGNGIWSARPVLYWGR